MRLLKIILPMLVMAISVQAVVVTYTSTLAGGNWNSNSTWSPSAIPASGDQVIIRGPVTIPSGYTATIGTCPVNANAMSGGAAPDVEIKYDSGANAGSLTVATGGTYKLQGFQQHDGTGTTHIPAFTVQTGATFQIDECNGSIRYGIYPLAGSQGQYSAITIGTLGDVAGTSGTVITSIRNGSVNGILWQDNGTWSQMTQKIYGAAISHCGDAAYRCTVWNLYNVSSSLNVFDLEDSTFVDTGGVGGGTSNLFLNDTGATLKIHGNQFSLTTQAYTLDVGMNSYFTSITGTLEISNNILDKGLGVNAVLSQFTIAYNIIDGWYVSAGTYSSGAGWASFHDNLLRYRDCHDNAELFGGGTDIYFYCDTASGNPSNPHFSGLPNAVSWQNVTLSGWIWDYGDNATEGNCFASGPGTYTINIDHNVVLYGPNLKATCTIEDWGLITTPPHLNLTHNTSAGGSAGGAFYFGETGNPPSQALDSYKSNIYFDYAVRANAISFVAGSATFIANLVPPAQVTNNTNYNYPAVTIWTGGYNANCNPSTAQGTPYNVCTTGSTPGANDVNVNPMMVDTTRNMRKWAATRGQAATADGAIAAFAAGGVSQIPTLLNDLFWYVRTGYSPTNLALKKKGHDAADIGAVAITVYNSVQ